MPKLYFIRHAKTEMNKGGVWSGRTDCNISKEGKKTACEEFEYSSKDFDYYYCSPLKRTKQTLDAIIPNQLHVVDERIIERDFGDWEGKPYNIIDEATTELYIQGLVQPPNGETYQQVQERVISFVEDLFQKYNTEKILIATHATILRMVRDIFLPEMEKGPIKNTQIIILDELHYEKWRNKYE